MSLQVTANAQALLREIAGPGVVRVRLHISQLRPDGMDFGLVLLDEEASDDVLLLDGPVRVFAYEDHAPSLHNAVVDAVPLEAGGHGLVISAPDERKWLSCGDACTGLGKDDCGGVGPCGGQGCHVAPPPGGSA